VLAIVGAIPHLFPSLNYRTKDPFPERGRNLLSSTCSNFTHESIGRSPALYPTSVVGLLSVGFFNALRRPSSVSHEHWPSTGSLCDVHHRFSSVDSNSNTRLRTRMYHIRRPSSVSSLSIALSLMSIIGFPSSAQTTRTLSFKTFMVRISNTPSMM